MSNWNQLQQKINAKQPRRKRNRGNKAAKRQPDPLKTASQVANVPPAHRHSQIMTEFKILDKHPPLKKREPGRYLAIDCEFVGVGPEGRKNALGRCLIVNYYGEVIYDEYVRPKERVTDWRTWVSGVTPGNMYQAKDVSIVKQEVMDLLQNRVLVGHSIHNDLKVLGISMSKQFIRDTATLAEYRAHSGGKPPSLKKLAQIYFNIEIQHGSHSSVEDAQMAMLLFRIRKKDFKFE
ncbi:hypothetical protein JNB11_01440 [Kocuria palustris]|nr:hypothetical protein [Kocuria palustris]